MVTPSIRFALLFLQFPRYNLASFLPLYLGDLVPQLEGVEMEDYG